MPRVSIVLASLGLALNLAQRAAAAGTNVLDAVVIYVRVVQATLPN